jgi:hypothetical protein
MNQTQRRVSEFEGVPCDHAAWTTEHRCVYCGTHRLASQIGLWVHRRDTDQWAQIVEIWPFRVDGAWCYRVQGDGFQDLWPVANPLAAYEYTQQAP